MQSIDTGKHIDIHWHDHLVLSLGRQLWTSQVQIDWADAYGPCLYTIIQGRNVYLLRLSNRMLLNWALPCFYVRWRDSTEPNDFQVVALGRNTADLLQVVRNVLAPVMHPTQFSLLAQVLDCIECDGVTRVIVPSRPMEQRTTDKGEVFWELPNNVVPWTGDSGEQYHVEYGQIIWHNMVVALFVPENDMRGHYFKTYKDGIWTSTYGTQHWQVTGPQGALFEKVLQQVGIFT